MGNPISLHGPIEPQHALVLDSPHSGSHFPSDFNAVVSEFDLRDGEDCFIDELYMPSTELGVPLLVAQLARTYIDPNRNANDIDPDLIDGRWPYAHVPSGKAKIGKSLIWRTLDDGRPIYRRKLSVDEVVGRIERCHSPYHAALRSLMDATYLRFGTVYHINCHSMKSVAGKMGEDAEGSVRADFVLGDRDGTTCDPAFTNFVRATLTSLGYDVTVNDPYKGVELVKAYSSPGRRRHSLQIEINKRLYMDEASRERHDGFTPLQKNLHALIEAVIDYVRTRTRHV